MSRILAPRAFRVITLALTSQLFVGVVRADDEALSRAKDLYLTASYEDALAVLNGLKPDGSSNDALQIAEYRVFCLLALNRRAEAQKAIETLVKSNPFYQPSDAVASPRIRAVFLEVRRNLISSLIQSTYTEAKAAFDRRDPIAASLFQRVLDLLADPTVGQTMSDLRTVATGFRDLSLATATPDSAFSGVSGEDRSASASLSSSGAPAVSTRHESVPQQARNDSSASRNDPPANAGNGKPAPSAPQAERDSTVTPPEVIFQPMPTWTPSTAAEAAQTFRGSLELSIDENGSVLTAKMRKGANPRYDDMLVKAALGWRFKPARRDGIAIPYLRVVEIELRPTRQ